MILKKFLLLTLIAFPLIANSSEINVLQGGKGSSVEKVVIESTVSPNSTIENEDMIACLKFQQDEDVIKIYNNLIKILELEKKKYERIAQDLSNQLNTTKEELESLEYAYETKRISEEDYQYKREKFILEYLLAYEEYVVQLSSLKFQYNEFYKSLNYIKNHCEKGLMGLLIN